MYYCVFQIGFLQCVMVDDTLSGCVAKLNSYYYPFEETITQINFFGTEEDLEQLPVIEELWRRACACEITEEDLEGLDIEVTNGSLRCLGIYKDIGIEKLKDKYPDAYVV